MSTVKSARTIDYYLLRQYLFEFANVFFSTFTKSCFALCINLYAFVCEIFISVIRIYELVTKEFFLAVVNFVRKHADLKINKKGTKT